MKSCSGPLRVHPAALMGLQGGPEVAEWLPRVLPRCQNGCPESQNRDTKPPKWQPREAKKGLEPTLGFHSRKWGGVLLTGSPPLNERGLSGIWNTHPPPAHYLLEMGLKEGGVSEMVVKGGGFWRRDGVIPHGGRPAGRRRTP